MKRSIHASSWNKKSVRSIDDYITLKGGDIAFDYLD
jgi:hypothetical protein